MKLMRVYQSEQGDLFLQPLFDDPKEVTRRLSGWRISICLRGQTMQQDEMVAALEALIFACGEPVTFRELKKVFSRHLKELPAEERDEVLGHLSSIDEGASQTLAGKR